MKTGFGVAAIAVVAMVTVLLIGTCVMRYQDASGDRTLTAETLCRVVTFRLATRGGDAVVHYEVDGRTFEGLVPKREPMHTGDHFVLQYDPNDPEDVRVDLTRPTMDFVDDIDTVLGRITDVSTLTGTLVRFEYLVEDIAFTRAQVVEGPHAPRTGDECTVHYAHNNPIRAILAPRPVPPAVDN